MLIKGGSAGLVCWAGAYLVCDDEVEYPVVFASKLEVSPAPERVAVLLHDASSDIVVREHHCATRFEIGQEGN